MKLFIKKIILFTVFTTAMVIIAQALLSLRIKGKSINGHDNLELTSNINADLVFLGGSRCWVQFDPLFFDSAFKIKSENIGVDGHAEITMAIVRLKNYLSRNKRPQFAILSFDPFMSGGSLTNNDNFVFKNDFARYAFFPNDKDSAFVNYFKFNFFEKYVPLYSIFKYDLLEECISLKNSNISFLKYGYEIHNEKWDTISDPVTDSAKKFFFNKSRIPEIRNSLEELNKLCMQNKIRLLCIQTPVYRSIQDSAAFSNTAAICKSLSIPFVNANVEFISNNINYFYNSFHLNSSGVVQLDSVLVKDTTLINFLHH